eukprot:scaffold1136_cov399-Prasinococcus_capsulatus_cf.AAC.11
MSERVERAAGATAREECGDIYYPDPLTEEEDNSLEDEDSEAPLHGASSWVWEMIQGEAAQRSNSRDDTVAASIQKDDDIPVIEEDTAAARRCSCPLSSVHSRGSLPDYCRWCGVALQIPLGYAVHIVYAIDRPATASGWVVDVVPARAAFLAVGGSALLAAAQPCGPQLVCDDGFLAPAAARLAVCQASFRRYLWRAASLRQPRAPHNCAGADVSTCIATRNHITYAAAPGWTPLHSRAAQRSVLGGAATRGGGGGVAAALRSRAASGLAYKEGRALETRSQFVRQAGDRHWQAGPAWWW